jgi:lysophospholipase L1-like esterase
MNICIFGDSIVWGASDYQKGGWVERLKTYYIESQDDVDVYNLGISGDNTDDLLKRFKAEAIAREADLIIFAIGVNDSQYSNISNICRVDLARFENNLSELARSAKEITEKIIFVGLTKVDETKTLPWDGEKSYSNEAIGKYDAAIKDFCASNNFSYIDMKDVIGISDLADGLHPNHIGHKKMFEKIRIIVDDINKYKKL